MRSGKLLLGMTLALTGCWGYGYGYHHRGYYGGGGYYAGTVAYSQPQPVQGQVVVEQPGVQTVQPGQVQVQVGAPPPPAVVGEGISGSDGTRGWRITSQSPAQDFQRIVQALTRGNCQAEANAQGELRASCAGNVHLIIRFDQQNVYKLCAPGTDPAACTQTWSAIGN